MTIEALKIIATYGFIFLILTITAVLSIAEHCMRCIEIPSMVEEWVAEHDSIMTSHQRRKYHRGPFRMAPSIKIVYKIGIQDQKGRQRVAWLGFRYWFPFVKAPTLEVRWEDKIPSSRPEMPPRGQGSPLWDRDLDG